MINKIRKTANCWTKAADAPDKLTRYKHHLLTEYVWHVIFVVTACTTWYEVRGSKVVPIEIPTTTIYIKCIVSNRSLHFCACYPGHGAIDPGYHRFSWIAWQAEAAQVNACSVVGFWPIITTIYFAMRMKWNPESFAYRWSWLEVEQEAHQLLGRQNAAPLEFDPKPPGVAFRLFFFTEDSDRK